jgi:hypothetical protein
MSALWGQKRSLCERHQGPLKAQLRYAQWSAHSADGDVRKSAGRFRGSLQLKRCPVHWETAAISRSEQRRPSKGALDFLLRPATMAPRQHQGTKALTRRGKLARRRHTTAAREGADMAVWIMRRLQSLPCQGFTLARAATATSARNARTPINDRRDNVLRTRKRAHSLNCGGAIV